jgi:hypothetical protein
MSDSRAERIYALLLHLYPREQHRAFGAVC